MSLVLYPIYKKNTQLSGGTCNGTIYMEFTSHDTAICHKIDGMRNAYKVGEESSTASHTQDLWEEWDGNIYPQLKVYKIRKD